MPRKNYSKPSMSEVNNFASNETPDDNQQQLEDHVGDNRDVYYEIMDPDTDPLALAKRYDEEWISNFIANIKVPPHPNSTFDEERFVYLLAHSPALSEREKRNMIMLIAKIDQIQIDRLTQIFEEDLAKLKVIKSLAKNRQN